MWFGSNDATTGGQVSRLQKFLKSTGDYTYGEITGFYGPATIQAVQRWQARNDIVSYGSPDTTGYGAFGNATMAVMAKKCSNTDYRETPPAVPVDADTNNTATLVADLTSVDASERVTDPDAPGSSGEFVFKFTATAVGDDMLIKRKFNHIDIKDSYRASASGKGSSAISSGASEITKDGVSYYLVKEGTAEKFTTISNFSPSFSGQYFAELTVEAFPRSSGMSRAIKMYEGGGLVQSFKTDKIVLNGSGNMEPDNLATISKVSPSVASEGDRVEIYGTNLSGVTEVQFFDSQKKYLGATDRLSKVTSTYVSFTVSRGLVAMIGSEVAKIAVFSDGCKGVCESNRLGFSLTSNTAPAPTMSLSLSTSTILKGNSTVLSWSSYNASYCTDGGKLDTSGTSIIDGVTATKEFTITCVGDGGSVTKSVTVNVYTAIPTMTLTVSPSTISPGDPVTISWTSENTNYCSDEGGKSNTSDSMTVNSFTTSKEYWMTCYGDGASVTKMVKVTVTAPVAVTPPYSNKMSCSNPPKSGLQSGDLVCYGTWDYGNDFGGDNQMCDGVKVGPTYSKFGTGCSISTPACSTGAAIATNLVNISSASAGDLSTIASNLAVSTDILKKGMLKVWEYKCTSPLALPSVAASISEPYQACVDLSRNMHRGAESSAVLMLQKFLASKGMFRVEPTAFYGDVTVNAVRDYQRSVNLPETGMVFDFTRAAMKKETCSI
ncbi:MAG: peptidoglycan-binding protein [Candidatus Pacebacteria bacterium]|nr:peptidoglycan-binding protein [Candidatus Paceibacterota bacterium]